MTELLSKANARVRENKQVCIIGIFYYSAAALLAMQSAVIATAIPSVRQSVRHTLVNYLDE